MRKLKKLSAMLLSIVMVTLSVVKIFPFVSEAATADVELQGLWYDIYYDSEDKDISFYLLDMTREYGFTLRFAETGVPKSKKTYTSAIYTSYNLATCPAINDSDQKLKNISFTFDPTSDKMFEFTATDTLGTTYHMVYSKSAAPKTLALECPFMLFECDDYDSPDPYLYFALFSQKWDKVMDWIADGKNFKKLTAGTFHDITNLTDGDLGSLSYGPEITKVQYKWTGTDVLRPETVDIIATTDQLTVTYSYKPHSHDTLGDYNQCPYCGYVKGGVATYTRSG